MASLLLSSNNLWLLDWNEPEKIRVFLLLLFVLCFLDYNESFDTFAGINDLLIALDTEPFTNRFENLLQIPTTELVVEHKGNSADISDLRLFLCVVRICQFLHLDALHRHFNRRMVGNGFLVESLMQLNKICTTGEYQETWQVFNIIQ